MRVKIARQTQKYISKMKELKIGNLFAKVPIVQGGMGVGISLSGLASAVANAGGVGVISSAGLGVIYNEFSKNLKKFSFYRFFS